MACPTTKAAASEHSQRTVAGDLLGLAHLPDRFLRDDPRRPSGVPLLKRAIIGVSMMPEHTALMRMFG
ncbi:MAG: hypothetical protein JWP20_1082, partial [Roseomonas sp.]|nr:hypothetical protein [Roseomonas sp.]